MMNRTDIEWCRNPDGSPSFTSNPITGCWGPGGSEERRAGSFPGLPVLALARV